VADVSGGARAGASPAPWVRRRRAAVNRVDRSGSGYDGKRNRAGVVAAAGGTRHRKCVTPGRTRSASPSGVGRPGRVEGADAVRVVRNPCGAPR